jgi:hypothetical protein
MILISETLLSDIFSVFHFVFNKHAHSFDWNTFGGEENSLGISNFESWLQAAKTGTDESGGTERRFSTTVLALEQCTAYA